MPAPRETALVVDVARRYWLEEQSQSQIAEELGISRSNVSRILRQGRERGIVEITIHDPDSPPMRHADLEQRLLRAFPVAEAHVVSAPRSTGLECVARAGARLMEERAARAASVGVSWGHTVQAVVHDMAPQSARPAVRVLPLVGGLSALDQLASGDSVLKVLAARLGATGKTLYAPAILESAAAAAALRDEPSIRRALQEAARVDLALIGVGSLGQHSSPLLLEGMGLSLEEKARFSAQNPVGDLVGRFITSEGEPVGPPTSHRVIAVDLHDLRRIREVIAVADGGEKAPGVAGALRSGAIDVIVIDVALARALLGVAAG